MGKKNPTLPERKCDRCGRVVRLNDNYCPSCGALLAGGKAYSGQVKSSSHHVDNPGCVDYVADDRPDRRSRAVAGILAILFGCLGLHNFYLGYHARAICQLVLAVIVGPFTLFLASFAVGIWAFIEGVLILSAAPGYRADARGIPLCG